MDKILALALSFLGVAILVLAFPEGNVAFLALIASASIALLVIRSQVPDEKTLLTRLFLAGLLCRIGFGLFIHVFDLRAFFGGDATTYDLLASKLQTVWFEGIAEDRIFNGRDYIRLKGVGWGMSYFLAGIYSIVGRNILAAQFIFATVGAAISPLVYVCALRIFRNRRVALISACFAAFYPSFVIWTGQLLKDGIIIFLLVLAVVMVLRLQKRFDLVSLSLLLFALFGIVSLRFYIFYMIATAIVGAFVVGIGGAASQSMVKRAVVVTVLGLGLTYLGVIQYATTEFERYGSLESVQRSRDDAAGRSESGFGADLDVSTTEGAILAVPVGFTYLMFAPFPWQVTNFRQTITLPDMVIWWISIPFLVSGLLFTIRTRLRATLGILIFTSMLTLVYSVFQGNVGTAYRQRAQIQVFLFIFVGVGVTLYLEKRENKAALKKARSRDPRIMTR